jgi:hypothetical protein
MKFYTVLTDEGPQLVNTQQDVKAAGQKKLIIKDIPTDKDGLRDFVNSLMREAYSREPGPVSSVPSVASQIVHDIDNPKSKEKAPISTDDIIEAILDSESYHFSNIFSAVIEKFDRLKREANALPTVPTS